MLARFGADHLEAGCLVDAPAVFTSTRLMTSTSFDSSAFVRAEISLMTTS
jgi:hypothetical protein